MGDYNSPILNDIYNASGILIYPEFFMTFIMTTINRITSALLPTLPRDIKPLSTYAVRVEKEGLNNGS